MSKRKIWRRCPKWVPIRVSIRLSISVIKCPSTSMISTIAWEWKHKKWRMVSRPWLLRFRRIWEMCRLIRMHTKTSLLIPKKVAMIAKTATCLNKPNRASMMSKFLTQSKKVCDQVSITKATDKWPQVIYHPWTPQTIRSCRWQISVIPS